MYIRLISAVLSCAFVLAILGQQVTPLPHPQIGSAQQTYEVAIDFNRRVPMRDRTELSADVYRPKGPGRFHRAHTTLSLIQPQDHVGRG